MDAAAVGGRRGSSVCPALLVVAVLLVLAPPVVAELRVGQPVPVQCPVTVPNNNQPAADLLDTFSAQTTEDYFHGTNRLWVGMWWPNGVIDSRNVHYDPDGSLAVKTPWFRGPDTRGQLVITGRRLDAEVPPIQYEGIPSYGGASVEVSSVNYPTPGCWQVTGTVGDAALTFVAFVIFYPGFGMAAPSTPSASPAAVVPCLVTTAAEGEPGVPEYRLFGDRPGTPTPGIDLGEDAFYGIDGLWVGVHPDGLVRVSKRSDHVGPDGAVTMKFLWYRDEAARGQLLITGERLDATAPPLRANVPGGYGDVGVQATGLTFPTPGCWRVSAYSGEASLDFVVLVEVVPAPPPTSLANATEAEKASHVDRQ